MFFLLNSFSVEEQDKFLYIYNKFHRRLYNYAYSKLPSKEDTEDVIQHTFEHVLMGLDKIRDVESSETSGLLFLILKRLIIKKHAEITKNKSDSIEEIDSSDLDKQIIDPVWEQVAPQIAIDNLKEILSSYSEDNQLLFIGRAVYHYSYKELALILNISEKNASVRYSRLREQIKKEWGEILTNV